ncbi:MAG: helix-turn-helix domain-containing protein [Oscillospiraceae bacterium]|jgi:SOS-response transcriptional repressor LexA/DNA-binding Xre family transcriptional regulator|nr:helix-turn-helix domain-containing protein [Oscillospiraceae bacterium]
MFLKTLSQLMKENDIGKSELSRRAGIPYTTIDGWFKKSYDGVRLETLLKLANFFDISIDYLVHGKSDGITLEEKRLCTKYGKLDRHGQKVVSFVVDEEVRRITEAQLEQIQYRPESKRGKQYIPLYLTTAAAGLAAPIEGDDFEMIELMPEAPVRAQFAVRISGDSMEPQITDGQIVYCVKDGISLDDGDIGIFCVDGAYYCKQYRSDGENMYLISLNRKRSDSDITIWGSGSRRATFLGKVLGVRV